MTKDIVIIDYGAGNVQSVRFALERLGYYSELTSNPNRIASANRVIFPGVGEASSAMNKLRETGLDVIIPALKQPVLGICLGMQLLCTHSEEGNTPGLNVFQTEVKRFPTNLKVPQIGWNRINGLKGNLFKDLNEGAFVYLVHSYYAPVCDESIAVSEYGISFSAALKNKNFYGVQFHPEKSSKDGALLLKNFIESKEE